MEGPLIGREEDQKRFFEKLKTENILVLSGESGIGKTKFAFDSCQRYAQENGYSFSAVVSYGRDPIDDIEAVYQKGQKTLLLIDDANDFPFLSKDLLFFLDHGFFNDLKAVITIRESKKKDFLEQIDPRVSYLPFYLPVLPDLSIDKILDSEGIASLEDRQKIERIAAGNARCAIMAVDLVRRGEAVPSSIYGIYSIYFKGNKQSALSRLNRAQVAVLCCASLSAFVEFSELDPYRPLLKKLTVSEESFRNEADYLCSQEIIDIYEEKEYSIHDQILRNFLLYNLFVSGEHFLLKDLLILLYPTRSKQVKNAILTLEDIFAGKEMETAICIAVKSTWNIFADGPQDVFEKFAFDFSQFYPEAGGDFALERIEGLVKATYALDSLFDDRTIAYFESPIYNLVLSAYFSTGDFKYLKSFFSSIASKGLVKEGFNCFSNVVRLSNPWKDNFICLNALAVNLFKEANNGSDSLRYFSYLAVDALLEFSLPIYSRDENYHLIYETRGLPLTSGIESLRKSCLDFLSTCFRFSEGKAVFKKILDHYVERPVFRGNLAIIKYDLPFLGDLIAHQLSPLDFDDCLCVIRYHDLLLRHKFEGGFDFSPFLGNKEIAFCQMAFLPNRVLYAKEAVGLAFVSNSLWPCISDFSQEDISNFVLALAHGIHYQYKQSQLINCVNLILQASLVQHSAARRLFHLVLSHEETADAIRYSTLGNFINGLGENVIYREITTCPAKAKAYLMVFFAALSPKLYSPELASAIESGDFHYSNYHYFDADGLKKYYLSAPAFFIDAFSKVGNQAFPITASFLFEGLLSRGNETSEFVGFFNKDFRFAFSVYIAAYSINDMCDIYGANLHYFFRLDPLLFGQTIPLIEENEERAHFVRYLWKWDDAYLLLDIAFEHVLAEKDLFSRRFHFEPFLGSYLSDDELWGWIKHALEKRQYSLDLVDFLFGILNSMGVERKVALLKKLVLENVSFAVFKEAFDAFYMESFSGTESEHFKFLLGLYQPFESELRKTGKTSEADLVLEKIQNLSSAKEKQEKLEAFETY